MPTKPSYLLILLALLTGSLLTSAPVQADQTFIVTLYNDPVPNGCQPNHCSLREAIIDANTTPGADTIVLNEGIYLLGRWGEDQAGFNGDLDITGPLTINGAGATRTIIDGNGYSTVDRVFDIFGDNAVSFNDLTIRDGTAFISGGGIANRGDLSLNNVIVEDNEAGYTGGGIYNEGRLRLHNVTIRNNWTRTSPGEGGGIDILAGNVTITSSAIYSNTTVGNGGGLALAGGSLTLINTTVSGNQANGSGGGLSVFQGGTANFYNVTLALNTANADNNASGQGGGIYGGNSDTPITIRNSLIALNTTEGSLLNLPNDCYGALISEGYNLIGITNDCTITGSTGANKTDVGPQIGPLADNGGPTLTHALNPGSPAIDAGNPAGCKAGSASGLNLRPDQRGYIRSMDGDGNGSARCDIGAFEFASSPLGSAPAPASTQVFLPVVLK